MSTSTSDAAQGVPQGALRPARPAPDPRSSEELIGAAAADRDLTAVEAEDLLGYYLANDELPGDSEALDVEVELGHGDSKRKLVCTIRTITWAEWKDGQDRATSADGQKFDTYTACSWHVARALIKPQLGPTVLRQQQEAKASEDGKIAGPGGMRIEPASDAAMLLRRMFLRQSGALLDLSAKVIEISKLGAGTQAVSEVEAAKN